MLYAYIILILVLEAAGLKQTFSPGGYSVLRESLEKPPLLKQQQNAQTPDSSRQRASQGSDLRLPSSSSYSLTAGMPYPVLDKVFYLPPTKISGGFYTPKNKNTGFLYLHSKILGVLCVVWWHESQVFQISLVYFYVKRQIWSDLLSYNFLGSWQTQP